MKTYEYPPTPNPTVDREDLGLLLLFAMRYALGRRSTAPSDIANMIRCYWQHVRPRERTLLHRDLDEAIAGHYRTQGEGSWALRLGDECDVRTWENLLAWMISKRSENGSF